MLHVLVTGGNGTLAQEVLRSGPTAQGLRFTVIDARAVQREPVPDDQHYFVHADVRTVPFEELDEPGSANALLLLHLETGSAASSLSPIDLHTRNVSGTVRMLDWARHKGIGRIVLGSSLAVYGEAEVGMHKVLGLAPADMLGATLLAAERFCQVHARLHGTTVTVLRLGTWAGEVDSGVGVLFRAAMNRKVGDGFLVRDVPTAATVPQVLRALEEGVARSASAPLDQAR
jgi:nucleoside-diphosphate-sugar epimerase